PPRYGAFIDWLATQSLAPSEAYYRRALAGFEEPTLVDPSGPPPKEWIQISRHLSKERSTQLVEVARRLRVTLSTLVHAAWGIVLARYTRKDDVVFGSTTSGRGASVPRIDLMVGLFINAVPVRVRLSSAPLSLWLAALQDQFNELR